MPKQRRPHGSYHGNRLQARRLPAGVMPIRLSQCMIVKNEEKNMERALSWGRGVVFEQIVVDTGSTDRTVEFAEAMGAKVFHFEWINDFAAAKNFAIEQAKGNWIAFLDADEYFSEEDAAKLKQKAAEVDGNPNVTGLLCDWLQYGSDGRVFAVHDQVRVFRNRSDVRYAGRIHEGLAVPGTTFHRVSDIRIHHTGYTAEAYAEANKADRNIVMLREEIARNPDEITYKSYLADSLTVDKSNTERLAEAEDLYWEVLRSERALSDLLLRNAYDYMIPLMVHRGDIDAMLELCSDAVKRLQEDHPDYRFYYGAALQAINRYDEAWEQYRLCEQTIETSEALKHRMKPENLETLFYNMAQIAARREGWHDAINYSSLTITLNKYHAEAVRLLIMITHMVNAAGASDETESIAYLQQFYDFNDPHDKLFLAKAAKEAKDDVLMLYFAKSITDEDKAVLAAG